MIRRYAPIAPSRGTTWPPEARAHIATHQPLCIGPAAGMPGECEGQSELDHIRGSGAISKKSESIATNGARTCSVHHRLKTEAGKTWRPRFIEVVDALSRDCARCSDERARVYGVTA